ncbi:MAG TPA: ABC transporter ATP-binding protein [Gammaproteobacteria bacterium]|nr:ABC transporter ATP-binding protein [Gammaproteobacteria bacterium]
MQNQLELRELSVRLGGKAVVQQVSLALQPGELTCLVGPSGCGKTTLLRAIAGFEQPCAGSISLHGNRVADARHSVPPEKRGIGMVFQDLALFPHLTVAGNIAFGMRGQPRPAIDRRIDELLELVDMPALRNCYPHQLSGGQQQRIALIRAMAPRPALLLLDEPFSSQDMERREQLVQEVRNILARDGITAMLVTHDQHEAFAFADTIGVINDGRLLQWDSAFDLYHRPKSRFVADFIGQGVLLGATVLDRETLQTELGKIRGELSRQLPGGSAVELLIRPDDIVHDDSSPVRARVVNRLFRGASHLYTLELTSGGRVLCLAPSHHDHRPGEQIGIRLNLDHLVIFPAKEYPSEEREPATDRG